VTRRESRQRSGAYHRAADGDIFGDMWVVSENRVVGSSDIF
jgi:hypothetical protein